MTVQSRQAVSQAGDGRLGHDRLQQRGDELAQQAPSLRPGQAARGKLSAQRGESPSPSTSGSSRRMIKRWAKT
jgi:hypothetical protein